MDLLVNGLTSALCSTRPTPSLWLVQSVVCSLFSVQSYPWTLVRSAAADIDSRSQCADASRSVPVRAMRVRRVHGSSWPRKSVLCQCAHAFLNFCAQLCACVLEFLCPVVRMLTLQVCACVFHQFRTTHHGLLVCRVRHCVSDRLKVAFEAPLLFVRGLLVTWLLSVSNALPWSLELANPLIMVLSKIDSGVPHWCTPGTVHERSVKELIWNWKDCWKVQIAIAVSPGWKNACHHNDRDLSAHSMNTTRPQNRSGRSLQLSRCPTLGLPQSLYWVLGYSKSVVVPPTLHFCSRSWLEFAHLVSCDPTEYSPSGFFFFFLLFLSAGFRFDKERCTCEKDILNLSFPVRKAGGSDFKTVHLLTPFFFFFFLSFSFSMIFLWPHFGHITIFRILAM